MPLEDQQRVIFIKVSQSTFHSISASIMMIMGSGFGGKLGIFKVTVTLFPQEMGKQVGVCVWKKALEPVPGGGRSGDPGAKSGTHSSLLSQLRAVTTGLGTQNIC